MTDLVTRFQRAYRRTRKCVDGEAPLTSFELGTLQLDIFQLLSAVADKIDCCKWGVLAMGSKEAYSLDH